jgi:hypothetical protein
MANRRSVPKAILALLFTFLFLAAIGAPMLVSAEPLSEDGPVPPQEGEERTITPYYIKALSGQAPVTGTLSPAALSQNDSLAEITTNGPMFPRFLINNVGSFTMYVDRMPLLIWGVNYACVWAKSNEDVQGAQFRMQLRKNGASQRTMNTNTAQLGSAPMEFTVSDPPTFPEPLVINPGDSLGVFIQYTARSRYPFGPAPGCIVLANNEFHATRVELVCSPMWMNVSAPAFSEGHLHTQSRIIDTSDLDPAEQLMYSFSIIPSGGNPVGANLITRESFAPTEDEVVINWSWDYKKSHPTDGLFEFKIDVSYGVFGINYTNSSFYEVKFPKGQDEDSGIAVSSNLLVGIGVIVILAILGVVLVMRRRSEAYPPGYYGARGPPPKGRPKPKGSWARSRAAKKAMKRGGPPPGPPSRSPDRTPMPGKAPPTGRAPPPGAPPKPHAATGSRPPRPRRR